MNKKIVFAEVSEIALCISEYPEVICQHKDGLGKDSHLVTVDDTIFIFKVD